VELIRASYKDSKEPFKDSCEHLLNYFYEQQWSHDQELITHRTMRPRMTQAATQEENMHNNQLEDQRMAAYGQQMNDDLPVPDAWWKGATNEEQEILRQMRTRIKARSQAKKEYQDHLRTASVKSIQDGEQRQVHAKQAIAMSLPGDSDDEDEDPAVFS
jgi:hypothetical protein